ncbi:hypothetical protein K4G60_g5465, partial [Candida parapsilosis]
MKLSTASLVSLAALVGSSEATWALFEDLFKDCAPKHVKPICKIKDIFCDTDDSNESSVSARDGGSVNFKAAFVVSGAERNDDGTYNVVANYEADQSDQLHQYFGGDIDSLSLTGTGCDDVHLYGKSASDSVENAFKWSTKFQCKPKIKNGKCCLPDGFSVGYDFSESGSSWDALKSVFGSKSCSYGINTQWSFVKSFDPYALLNKELSLFKRDEVVEGVDGSTTFDKRTLGFLLDLLGKCTTKKKIIKQFCWDCECPSTSSSSTVPPSTSSTPPTESSTPPTESSTPPTESSTPPT